MSTLYNKDQIQDSITGYLWYDAPWGIIRAVYPFIGDSCADIGAGPGIMMGVVNTLKSAEGKQFFSYSADDIEDFYGTSDESYHTAMSSHVLEHLSSRSQIDRLVFLSWRLATNKIIHIVPDGNVNDKNLGTPHKFEFNRLNFIKLFEGYEKQNQLKRIHYGPIKGDRMDSLMYVGEVVK